MKQLNVKKLVLLNLPYFLLGLFATNLGEAWRLATGADASAKMLSFFSTLPVELEIRRNVVKKIKYLLETKWLKDVDITYL